MYIQRLIGHCNLMLNTIKYLDKIKTNFIYLELKLKIFAKTRHPSSRTFLYFRPKSRMFYKIELLTDINN